MKIMLEYECKKKHKNSKNWKKPIVPFCVSERKSIFQKMKNKKYKMDLFLEFTNTNTPDISGIFADADFLYPIIFFTNKYKYFKLSPYDYREKSCFFEKIDWSFSKKSCWKVFPSFQFVFMDLQVWFSFFK